MDIKYLDFDLLIERSADRYRARVLNSPAGQAKIEFDPPFTESEIDAFFLQIGQTRSIESEEARRIREFGRTLFESVFAGEVRDCLSSSLKEAGAQSSGLRIRLRLGDTPELAGLPWEFMYDPGNNSFFALTVQTPIVRFLEVPLPVQPLAVQPPLRILAMLSGPKDFPRLDLEYEWQNLQESLKGVQGRGLVDLQRLYPPTLTALQEQLRREQYHIFHFIGHGIFSERERDGFLLLENELHEGRRVSGRNLGSLLRDHSSLRLAVLNACEGARADMNDQFAGSAQSLIQQGIPAVIAMQFRITDKASITLAGQFYGALADGYPVDAALGEARKAIHAGGNDLEWGTPVLYMRSPDGFLFDVSASSSAGPLKPVVVGGLVGSVPAGEAGGTQRSAGETINLYTKLSEDEETQLKRKSELRALDEAVDRSLADLRALAATPLPERGNPFLFVQSFAVSDRARFFGRDEILADLLDRLQSNPTTFLDGASRTSMIQAGLIPALLDKGHLPLLVTVSAEPLAASIKRQLVPSIEAMPFLGAMSLADFLRHVTDRLSGMQPPGKLIILVDEFEALFDQPERQRAAFAAEWNACVSGTAAGAHWLFTVPTGSTWLLNMFKDRAAVNANLVTLQPLTREEASRVIEGQTALRGIQVDPDVMEVLLRDLARPGIDPTQLQVVAYMLSGGSGPPVRHWTMEDYNRQGGVDGILQGYLDRTINELDPEEREPAWQLLSTLIDPSERAVSEAELVRRMQAAEVDEQVTRRALKDLTDSHLVEYSTAYHLTSDSLKPSIQGWRDRRAALVKGREEVWRQMRSVGASALRGLFGGALGFMLAYWALPYVERVNPFADPVMFFEWYVYNLVLRAYLGAQAGFLLMLGLDLALASFTGKKRRLRLPAAMLAGAGAFALALAMHINLHYLGDQLLLRVGLAALEGIVWGMAAGAGALWLMQSSGMSLPKLLLGLLGVSAACGLLLVLAESLLNGLDLEAPVYAVFAAGMIFPLFLIGSALLGRANARKAG